MIIILWLDVVLVDFGHDLSLPHIFGRTQIYGPGHNVLVHAMLHLSPSYSKSILCHAVSTLSLNFLLRHPTNSVFFVPSPQWTERHNQYARVQRNYSRWQYLRYEYFLLSVVRSYASATFYTFLSSFVIRKAVLYFLCWNRVPFLACEKLRQNLS